MKNNVDGNIGALIEAVSPGLLYEYSEKHNMSHDMLPWVNEEYPIMCQRKDALRRKGSVLFWSWVAGILVFACYAPAAILELFGFFTLMILWQVLVLRAWKEEEKTTTKYYNMLCEFRDAIEGLYSKDSVPHLVDEHSVRAMLVSTAAELLAAQQFLEKHRHGQYSAEILFNSCRVEADCSREFNRKMQTAAEFGLTFKKSELFHDAAMIFSCFKI